jgi:hypothetical protein
MVSFMSGLKKPPSRFGFCRKSGFLQERFQLLPGKSVGFFLIEMADTWSLMWILLLSNRGVHIQTKVAASYEQKFRLLAGKSNFRLLATGSASPWQNSLPGVLSWESTVLCTFPSKSIIHFLAKLSGEICRGVLFVLLLAELPVVTSWLRLPVYCD